MKKLIIFVTVGISLLLVGCGSSKTSSSTNSTIKNIVTIVQSQTYTITDVAKHSTANDCWTIVGGNVYDLTSFVGRHPGGDVILQACGIDGTNLFNNRNGLGPHPGKAETTLATLKIGVIK
ncbi:MAG: cytochrome b5-like heme/steroid binding domain-containing protein [bacterium]